MANQGIVGVLKVLLGLNTAEFEEGAKKARNSARNLENDIAKFGKSFAGAFLPVAGVAAAGVALAGFTRSIIQTAGEVTDLADQTGLTTDSIQEMKAAANLTSTSLEAFTNAAFKLGVNLATGTDRIRQSVEALGLSYQTLRNQSPDQQFKAIASALGEVEDVQLRNKLAVDLFGRTAKEILPAIAQGYGEIADAAWKANEDQLRAVDAAADALSSFWTGLKAQAIDVLGTIVINFRDSWNFIMIAPRKALEEWNTILQAMGLKSAVIPKAFGEARVAASLLPAPLKDITMSLEEQNRVEKELTESVKKKTSVTVKGINEVVTAQQKWLDSIVSINRSGFAMLYWLEPLKPALQDARDAINEIRVSMDDLPTQSIRETGDATAEANRELMEWANTHGAVFAPAVQQSSSAIEEATQETKTWRESISDLAQSFHHLAQIATGGLSGFAAWVGTVTSAVDLATKAGDALKSGYEKLKGGLKNLAAGFMEVAAGAAAAASAILAATNSSSRALNAIGGAAAGAAIGSQILPGLGTAIGAAAGLLIGLFRKPKDEAELFRRELMKQHGTFDALEKKAQSVGQTFADVWGGKGKKGAEALAARLKIVNDLLEEQERKLKAAIDALETEIADARSELDGLIGDADRMGYVFDKAGNLVSVKFDKMKEIADRFGVNLEALGPKFHAQRIAKDAQDIINAFTLLDKGGTEVGTILEGLADEISTLVQDSKKFGTTIPENMRPWIEELLRAGKLTDENGEKLKSLEGINFGPAVETEFETISKAIKAVITKIGELIEKLDILISKQIPDKSYTVTEKIVTDDQRDPREPRDIGPEPDESTTIPAAHGGLFRRPTRVLLGEGGEPELVGPVDFMSRALRGAMDRLGPSTALASLGGLTPALAGASATAQPVQVTHYHHHSYEISAVDGESVARIVPKLTQEQNRLYTNNPGGVRTDALDALGISRSLP